MSAITRFYNVHTIIYVSILMKTLSLTLTCFSSSSLAPVLKHSRLEAYRHRARRMTKRIACLLVNYDYIGGARKRYASPPRRHTKAD